MKEMNKMWINAKNNLQDLLPRGEVDPIPDWVTELVVKPLEDCGLIEKVKTVFFSLSGSVVNPNYHWARQIRSGSIF
jgi:hypothetical protein